MQTFTAITYEVERGRARITLNRPDKLNALSPSLLGELHDALWEADDDREVHGVILRGVGRCFERAPTNLARRANVLPREQFCERGSRTAALPSN